jgi:hypothetical protein
MIRALVQDDWTYLRQPLRLSGDELDHWQEESALRRAAQVAGQWASANYESLPGLAARFSRVAQTNASQGDSGWLGV